MAPGYILKTRFSTETPQFPPQEQPMSYNQYTNQFESGIGGNGMGINPNQLNMNAMNRDSFNQSTNFGGRSNTINDDDLAFLFQTLPNNSNNNHNPDHFISTIELPEQNAVLSSSQAADGTAMRSYHQPHSYGSFNDMRLQSEYQNNRIKMERMSSDSHVPMTPITPALGSLHIGTPVHTHNSALNQQARINAQHLWNPNVTPSSESCFESPLSSPHGMYHASLHEVMAGHGSMPTKLPGQSSSIPAAAASLEAKKRRRRASHNAVERRRRDNINDRIGDLATLLPDHRLDDEKNKKLTMANGPLSPSSLGASPPNFANSGLVSNTGRRPNAPGTITQGLPLDDKENKGANKGDILSSSVVWMRDLNFIAYNSLLKLQSMPGYVLTPDEQTALFELTLVHNSHPDDSFSYSRGLGSNHSVPGMKNLNEMSFANVAIMNNMEDGSCLWLQDGDSGRNSMSIKEEEEDFSMDMA